MRHLIINTTWCYTYNIQKQCVLRILSNSFNVSFPQQIVNFAMGLLKNDLPSFLHVNNTHGKNKTFVFRKSKHSTNRHELRNETFVVVFFFVLLLNTRLNVTLHNSLNWYPYYYNVSILICKRLNNNWIIWLCIFKLSAKFYLWNSLLYTTHKSMFVYVSGGVVVFCLYIETNIQLISIFKLHFNVFILQFSYY